LWLKATQEIDQNLPKVLAGLEANNHQLESNNQSMARVIDCTAREVEARKTAQRLEREVESLRYEVEKRNKDVQAYQRELRNKESELQRKDKDFLTLQKDYTYLQVQQALQKQRGDASMEDVENEKSDESQKENRQVDVLAKENKTLWAQVTDLKQQLARSQEALKDAWKDGLLPMKGCPISSPMKAMPEPLRPRNMED
jgi:hypothetical protein